MVKVFSHTSSFPPEQIGLITEILEVDSDQGYYSFRSERLKAVRIYGWKTPISGRPIGPIVQPPSILQIPQSQSQEIKNLELIIATLVNMMGGVVTVQPAEVENAVKFELTMMQFKDPHMLTISVEDKE